MSTIKVLGIDLGKSCFHLIGRSDLSTSLLSYRV